MIRELTDADREAYDAQTQHIMQSWAWGEFRKELGTHVVRQGEFVGRKMVRAWQFTIHRLPFLPYTVGYLPKGPLPDRQQLDALAHVGKQHHCLFIQLEPNVLEKDQEKLAGLPLKPAARPLFTKHNFLINLTQSEEELRAAMHSKTRYNMRLAQRKGVIVRIASDGAAFARHLNLYLETAKRQRYFGHNRLYHEILWNTFKDSGLIHLVQAYVPACTTHHNCLLASWMLIRWHDTMYYPYGGSSSWHKEYMGSTLVAWESILYAKRLGCTTLDLWGALGPNPDLDDSWYGFHRFKAGLGAQQVTYVGSYDCLLQPTVYRLFQQLNTLRWWLLSHL